MGNQQGVQPSKVGEDSYYKQYLIQMQRNPVSDVSPYRHSQIAMLKKVFEELDKKKNKSLEIEEFDNYYALRQHPLYERIRVLFKEEVAKIKVKKITFQIMLYLLSPFHIQTPIQEKYRYLFRLYDWDQDFKLSISDLSQTFEILFYSSVYDEDTYIHMAQKIMNKHGSEGYLKLEQFVTLIPQDQAKELMSLKFLQL